MRLDEADDECDEALWSMACAGLSFLDGVVVPPNNKAGGQSQTVRLTS